MRCQLLHYSRQSHSMLMVLSNLSQESLKNMDLLFSLHTTLYLHIPIIFNMCIPVYFVSLCIYHVAPRPNSSSACARPSLRIRIPSLYTFACHTAIFFLCVISNFYACAATTCSLYMCGLQYETATETEARRRVRDRARRASGVTRTEGRTSSTTAGQSTAEDCF